MGVAAAAPPEEDVPSPLRHVAPEDVYAVVGSIVGSFALVWLVFSDVLPLSGVVGFVVCWFVAFLAMYAGVTGLQPSASGRGRAESWPLSSSDSRCWWVSCS